MMVGSRGWVWSKVGVAIKGLQEESLCLNVVYGNVLCIDCQRHYPGGDTVIVLQHVTIGINWVKGI